MAPPLFGTVSEPSWPSTMPTWFVISSRELCKILDVTLQTLTEWRQRGIGPRPVPEGVYRPGVGRRKWYRLNEVMRWHDTLRGIDRETWEYDVASDGAWVIREETVGRDPDNGEMVVALDRRVGTAPLSLVSCRLRSTSARSSSFCRPRFSFALRRSRSFERVVLGVIALRAEQELGVLHAEQHVSRFSFFLGGSQAFRSPNSERSFHHGALTDFSRNGVSSRALG